MAPSSSRSLGAPRRRPRPQPPRACSTDAGASTGISYNAPDSLLPRLEAVDRDAARRKFAFYGHQHAHVDHLSGTEQDTTIVLQSTLLLQEDGLLAARLDDVSYLLDGLLAPATTQRGRLAQARSVLELAQLLQDATILQAVELSSQRRTIQAKAQKLLRSGLGPAGPSGGEEAQRLALAVLLFSLAQSSVAEEFVDEKVLDAVVHALKQEMAGDGDAEQGKAATETSVMHQSASLKKTCLKRKQTTDKGGNMRMNGARVFEQDESFTMTSGHSATSVNASSDAFQSQLEEMLQGNGQFFFEEKLLVSTADILCAALCKLLQMDCDSAVNQASDLKLAQRCQNREDTSAADTFRVMRRRKQQLVRNGGVDVLVCGLARWIGLLELLAPSTQIQPLSLDFTHVLHRVSMLLHVFDHVTFLNLDVQQYVAKRRELFELLLKLMRILSELSWGTQARRRWKSEPTRMPLVVEALLSALRVLINLTHHSVEAASHVHALDGMQLIAHAFTQLLGLVSAPSAGEKSRPKSAGLDKSEFDSCLLLLSAIVNCIEFSNDNRDALAGATLYLNLRQDGSSQMKVSACDLFTRFFQAKVESYVHLIELTEDQAGGGGSTISMEEGDDDWSPEDVILGGCTSLLLGYLMKGSPANSAGILNTLPDSSPRLLLRALSVFVAFHSQIGALTTEVAKSVLHVEEILKSYHETGAVASLCATASDMCEQLRASEAAPKSAEVDNKHFDDKTKGACARKSASTVGSRPLKNLCSNIDDSDSESVVIAKEKRRPTTQGHGSLTPTRTPPRSAEKKRHRAKSPMTTPAEQITPKIPPRGGRSPLTAVLPDGSLSSPVVARLLKRTRQLVEEFDADTTKRAKAIHLVLQQFQRQNSVQNTEELERLEGSCM
ncbi:hypothetical protein PF002_g9166 [Phytophthora fragariae]|uniref:Wings apart-like protein C-terminal domain-containing protein n=1 Tax=Phytophthora fragariae TaxID=53985 RepID=A0A6A3ZQI7_9STRA|nr:hypothetical protein PF002_g9166 [Phytophthora fragariae]